MQTIARQAIATNAIARRARRQHASDAVRRFKRTYAYKRMSKLQQARIITGHAFAAWFYEAFKEWRETQA